jgi:hypothetical protein
VNRKIRKAIELGLCSLLLSGVACSRTGADKDNETASGQDAAAATAAQPAEVQAVEGLSLNEQVSAAIADLVERNGIDQSEIQVVHINEVTWSSSALGCPEEGMNYTEALVPGLWLVLEAGEQVFYYHGATNTPLYFCPKERVKAPAYREKGDVM